VPSRSYFRLGFPPYADHSLVHVLRHFSALLSVSLHVVHLPSSTERIVIHPVRFEKALQLPAGALALQLRGHFAGMSVLCRQLRTRRRDRMQF
jgi:hypothetical protein